jgi:hypothetical protein
VPESKARSFAVTVCGFCPSFVHTTVVPTVTVTGVGRNASSTAATVTV